MPEVVRLKIQTNGCLSSAIRVLCVRPGDDGMFLYLFLGRSSKKKRIQMIDDKQCPHRVQIEPLVVRNLFSFGHLLDREGEREGDGQGDLCRSCARHLFAPQITEAL